MRSGTSLADGVRQAKADWQARLGSGVDQTALDQAAREGVALGAFEESAEEVITMVEEFFPEHAAPGCEMAAGQAGSGKPGIAEKLASKLDPASRP